MVEFDCTFRYDATLLAVTNTVPPVGGTFSPPAPGTYQFDVNWNEAVAPTAVQASDLTLSGNTGATVTNVELINGNTTTRFTLNILFGGSLTANIAAGRITDQFGNPNAAFSGSYTVKELPPSPTPTATATATPTATTTPTATPTASPRATALHHYAFDGPGVVDSVGTANGTLFNGASVSAGQLHLDGVDDYVQFQEHIVPTVGDFSVAFFAQEVSPQATYAEIISQGSRVGQDFTWATTRRTISGLATSC